MRTIILDLDGTLLNNKKSINDYTYQRFSEYKKQGDIIVINSGRPITSTLFALDKFCALVDYYILQNGAVIYDKELQIVHSDFLNKEAALNIYKRYKDQKKVDLIFYDENINSLINCDVTNKYLTQRGMPIKKFPIEKLPNNICKLLFIGSYNDLVEVEKDMNFYYDLEICFSSEYLLEVNEKGINKAKGITTLKNMLNTYHDVFVFGDNDNDVSMLKTNNYTICMANGSIKAKSAAKYISKYTNDEDGVVKFLDEFRG